MTEKMIDKYIHEMNRDLFDEVIDMLEEHSVKETTEKYNIPVEVAETLSWYWAID